MMQSNMGRRKIISISLIVLSVLLLLLGAMYLYSKRNEARENDISDSERFSEEYSEVPEDNMFVYADIDEIVDVFERGTGVVYLGFPECPWCQRYVRYLYEVAKEKGVEEIYYFNVRNDRTENSEGYQKLVSELDGFLSFDDEGNPRIYVPDVSFVVSGKIVGHDNETSTQSGDVDMYWVEERVQGLKRRLRDMFNTLDVECATCNV